MKVNQFSVGPISVNCYLTWDESTNKGFIVDPGDYSQPLHKAIDSNLIDLEYIILTHGHGDHIGGVERFKELFPNAKIVAHTFEKELLSDGKLNESRSIFRRDITVSPDIFVREGDTLSVGNLNLSFIHTPGHTKGGMCVVCENYIFSGDTLFRRSIGRTDFYGGDYGQIISSIKNKLFKYPDEYIVLPGHMGMTTIGEEKVGNPFV